jgi:hypothetical protein
MVCHDNLMFDDFNMQLCIWQMKDWINLRTCIAVTECVYMSRSYVLHLAI